MVDNFPVDTDMETHTSNVLIDHVAQRVRHIVTPLSLSVERIANIDRLRIVAAVGIVWFHTMGAPYRRIGYTGLPIFLLVFFSLILRSTHADSTAQFLKRRWDRLMVPWLFWSIVYGLCRSVKAFSMMDWSGLRDVLLCWFSGNWTTSTLGQQSRSLAYV